MEDKNGTIKNSYQRNLKDKLKKSLTSWYLCATTFVCK